MQRGDEKREGEWKRKRKGGKEKEKISQYFYSLNYWEKIEQIEHILFWDCLKICVIMNDTSEKQFLVQRCMLFHLGSILVASKDIPFHVYG